MNLHNKKDKKYKFFENNYTGLAIILLSLVLLTAFFFTYYKINQIVTSNCYKTLKESTNAMHGELDLIAKKDRQYISSAADLIGKQDNLHSDTTVSILDSFSDTGMLADVCLLFPNDHVLLPSGKYIDASGKLSFKKEAALGYHLSDKSVSLTDPKEAVVRNFFPVYQNKKIAALVLGDVNLKTFVDSFKVSVYNGKAQIFIVDGNSGDFLMDTWHKKLLNVNIIKSRKFVEGSSLKKFLADLHSGKSGKAAFVSNKIDETMYIYYRSAGINNWQIALTVPKPTVFALATKTKFLLFMLAIIYVMAFVAFALWIMKSRKERLKMFATTPAGICTIKMDGDLTITNANKLFYDIIGYTLPTSKRDYLNSLLAIIDPASREALISEKNKILKNAKPNGEFEFTFKSVKNIPITILARYYYDKNNNKTTINVIDISERKRMEEQLRINEQRYRLAMEQDEKMYFDFDIQKREAILSKELAAIYGNRTVISNLPERLIEDDRIVPESIDAYLGFYNEIFEGKPSCEALIWAWTDSKHDNPAIPWKFISTSIFNDKGEPVSAMVSCEDMSTQRQNYIYKAWSHYELSSAKQADEYATVEYNLTQNIMINRSGSLIINFSPTSDKYDDITDYALENFVYNEDFSECKTLMDRQRLLQISKNKNATESSDFRYLDKDSYVRWLNLLIQTVKDPYSDDILARFTFTDITSSKTGEINLQQKMEELQKELENSKIKVMLNQMQPHFLYNALSAIRVIIKSDPEYASKMVYDFTVHLRSSIRALQSDDPISFKDELKNIKAYLNIEQMRFGDKLKIEYHIECEDFDVLPLSIQPLAENAARHGIYPKGEDGGTIKISTFKETGRYVVEVADDGEGFDPDLILNSKSNSIGLKNLIFRLKSLMNATVEINSRTGIGTTVRVYIPIKNNPPER